MTCETVRLPGGEIAIVCSRGRRRRPRRCQMRGCQRPAERQCDFPKPDGGTCDRYLCADCSVSVAPDRDHCPTHPRPGDPAKPAKPVQLGLAFPAASP